jgi:hypothetical protein
MSEQKPSNWDIGDVAVWVRGAFVTVILVWLILRWIGCHGGT